MSHVKTNILMGSDPNSAPFSYRQAQAYPSRPVTIVVPKEPGSTTASYLGPAELGAFTKTELEYWGKVIKAGNIKIE